MDAPHIAVKRSILIDVGERHHPGEHRHPYPRGASPLHEAEIMGVVEEELGDEEVHPGIDLDLEMGEVARQVARLGMSLRIGGGSHAEAPPLLLRPDEGHQIAGVREPAGMRREGPLAAGRIAAQQEHVLDARLGHLVEDARHVVSGRPGAGDVCHRLDLGVELETLDEVDGPGPLRASGPVGHRDEGGPQRPERLHGQEELPLPLVGAGREELEGEDRLAALACEPEDVRDLHRGASIFRRGGARRE